MLKWPDMMPKLGELVFVLSLSCFIDVHPYERHATWSMLVRATRQTPQRLSELPMF